MNLACLQPDSGVATSQDAGFSLLEVMVASAIMGLVLVVLMQVLTGVLRAQLAARNHTQAVLVAEKVLERHCAAEQLTGTYQGQEGRFAYQVRINPQFKVVVPSTGKGIVCTLVQVTVSWQEQGKTKSMDLQTARTVEKKKL